MAAMLEHLGYRIGEAYQKFGQLADFADWRELSRVVRAISATVANGIRHVCYIHAANI